MSEYGDNLNAKRNWRYLSARTKEGLAKILNEIKIPFETDGSTIFAENRYSILIYSSRPLKKKKVVRKSIKKINE